MTIRETLQIKTNGRIIDRHELASGWKWYTGISGRKGYYRNLHLDKDESGRLTIFGYYGNEKKKLCNLNIFDPDEEYKPNVGVWLGGYEYLYIKK